MIVDLESLSAAELDEISAGILRLRDRVEPAVSNEPPPTSTVIDDPIWHATLIPQGTLLRLRHPSFGWIAFGLSPASAAGLMTTLLRQALTPGIFAAELERQRSLSDVAKESASGKGTDSPLH